MIYVVRGTRVVHTRKSFGEYTHILHSHEILKCEYLTYHTRMVYQFASILTYSTRVVLACEYDTLMVCGGRERIC